MPQTNRENGISPARLAPADVQANFSDLHPAYDEHEARVAADRCYFCHDAPCMTACPTSIDIPLFIRQIATGTSEAAAKTILDQNILGGMCARVCPTETLCEEVCVREIAEGKPVEIGRLQRHATDTLMAQGKHPFTRAASTGKTVAVVGAGPAGLACAHRLAMLGHDVVVFEARAKGGGLNEFGIAAYKSTNDFAQKELDWLLGIGGIDIRYDQPLGKSVTLDGLQSDFDAVFLGMGLTAVNALRLDGEDKENVTDAVDFIAELRQASDLSKLPVGRRVVVIGGGMTAIDAGVQAKLLGAEDVTIVYRRGQEAMAASKFEQDLAQQKGVTLICNATPVGIEGNGSLTGVTFAYTETQNGKLVTLDETFTLPADQLFKAIGQALGDIPDTLKIESGKITVDAAQKTNVAGVWAGGDCASGGDDLTVTAVAEGRDAAMDIHATLTGAS
ncbi:NAD(P)-dependent oxidoreductase [Aliiroseovarius sp. Z3]|uniref:NAD(P)-dependent oxidoreductase n=1 Tax=Aliiroseovarius sp. Z3 TaxID=2811402 RepID=UPI0023B2EC10|nr:NAD(P)-dependent oxidoreductase [Aliiroseovarius sp. Z3]MDE9450958.1 NAD(P)-dependent oxidoreductase [Aliiroseovarius sp. Z3]